MSTKRKRMDEIAQKWKPNFEKIFELYDKLIEKEGVNANWETVNTPEINEYMKEVNFMIEEIRDYYVLSKDKAIRYFWDAFRLKDRGKV